MSINGFPYNMFTYGSKSFEEKTMHPEKSSLRFVNCSPHASWRFGLGHSVEPKDGNDQKGFFYMFSGKTFLNWIAYITASCFDFYRGIFKSVINISKSLNQTCSLVVGPLFWAVGIILTLITSLFYGGYISVKGSLGWTLYGLIFPFTLFILLTNAIILTLNFLFTLLLVPIYLDYKTILEIIFCNKELFIFIFGLLVTLTAFETLSNNVSLSMSIAFALITLIRIGLYFKKRKKERENLSNKISKND